MKSEDQEGAEYALLGVASQFPFNQRDANGNPTGILIARPNAFLLYNTLNKLPKLSFDDQLNSTLAYQRELNRFGLTIAARISSLEPFSDARSTCPSGKTSRRRVSSSVIA